MNLDELRQEWSAQNEKIDRMVRLNREAVKEIRMSKAERSLRWLQRGLWIELAMSAVAVIWLGSFIADHLSQLSFVAPAVFVDGAVIVFIASCVRQLVAISALDPAGSVISYQKGLERLRILRIRTTKWTFAVGCVLWAPLLIVLFEGLLGVDLYRVVAMVGGADVSFLRWIVANVLFGLALAGGVVWVSNRYADRFDSSPFMKSLMDDIAGRSLTRAMQSVDSIRTFENEGEA